MPDVPVVKAGTAVFGSGPVTVVAALPGEGGTGAVVRAAREAAAAGAAVLTGSGALSALAEAGRETGLPVVAGVAEAAEVGRVAARVDMLRLAGPDSRLLEAAAETGLPVLLDRDPGDGAADWLATVDWLAAADRLEARGAGGVLLGVRGDRLAEVRLVRERAARPVLVDLRRPRVVPGLVPAVAEVAAGLGADALAVGLDRDAGIAGADLAGLADLAPLLLPGPAADPEDLAALRHRLDLLDEQIVRLVAHRRAVARLIGRAKRRDRLPARDLRRELQVLEHVADLARRLNADPGTVRAVFNVLIDDAVAVQRPAPAG